jgi:RNA recognition motif-containing protein
MQQQMQFLGVNIPNFGQQPVQKREYDNSTCLFVGNLSQTTFDGDLFKHFSSKGYKIKNARVMLDNSTQKPRGFGYLNFHTKEEAQRCLDEQPTSILDGR